MEDAEMPAEEIAVHEAGLGQLVEASFAAPEQRCKTLALANEIQTRKQAKDESTAKSASAAQALAKT